MKADKEQKKWITQGIYENQTLALDKPIRTVISNWFMKQKIILTGNLFVQSDRNQNFDLTKTFRENMLYNKIKLDNNSSIKVLYVTI